MAHSTVPGNSLQNRLRQHSNMNMAPMPGQSYVVNCKILEVYDQETLEFTKLPVYIEQSILEDPAPNAGIVWAKVLTIPKQEEKYVPFALPEEVLYSTFGNAPQLIGRMAQIQYTDTTADTGQLIVTRNHHEKHLNLRIAGMAYDIGTIV